MKQEKKSKLTDYDLISLIVSDFKEEQFEWHDVFSFQLDGAGYLMYLYEGLEKEDCCTIGGLIHKEEFCPFCTKEKIKYQRCDVLLRHKKELFNHVIGQSKNRLRWLVANIE